MIIRHIYRHRQKYIGAFYLLIIQLFILMTAFLVIRANYALFLKQEGDIVETKDIVVRTGQTIKKIATPTSFSRQYSGFFGSMITEQRILSSGDMLQHTYALVHQLNLSLSALIRYHIAQYYFDQGWIDGYMFKYLLTHYDQDLNAIVSQRSILYPILGRETPDWTIPPVVAGRIAQTKALIESQSYDAIFDHITTIQKSVNNIFATHRRQVVYTEFMKTPEFAYLYDKIHTDTRNEYRPHIDHFARLFGIRSELIKAAIMTEQLRGFFTHRGMVKHLIGSQRYMMVMQQASWGIGGIKEKTAIEVENYVRTYRPDLWTQTFAYLDESRNRSQTRFDAMTTNQHYAHQIAYIAGVLAMHRDQWARDGIILDNAPGVLLTLYNIGPRKPQPNPQMGGAVLTIDGQRMTFSELGLMMYRLFALYP